MAIKLTKVNFESEVLKSDIPVLVDFWAPWCGPCRTVAPILDELADELKGKVKIGKVNVDEESALAAQYSIMSIPTLMVVRNGKVVTQQAGSRDKEGIKNLVGSF